MRPTYADFTSAIFDFKRRRMQPPHIVLCPLGSLRQWARRNYKGIDFFEIPQFELIHLVETDRADFLALCEECRDVNRKIHPLETL